MTAEVAAPQGRIVDEAPPLWFLGTVVRFKLTGEHTGGRFALWEGMLPQGAAPPLHSHPQDETLYVLDGEISAWLGDPQTTAGRTCRSGAAIYAPGGAPHTFRVESGTARVLFISTPGGIDDMVLGLAEEARWPWLQPPPDGPRVDPERRAAVERETGVIVHGPAPPAAHR